MTSEIHQFNFLNISPAKYMRAWGIKQFHIVQINSIESGSNHVVCVCVSFKYLDLILRKLPVVSETLCFCLFPLQGWRSKSSGNLGVFGQWNTLFTLVCCTHDQVTFHKTYAALNKYLRGSSGTSHIVYLCLLLPPTSERWGKVIFSACSHPRGYLPSSRWGGRGEVATYLPVDGGTYLPADMGYLPWMERGTYQGRYPRSG